MLEEVQPPVQDLDTCDFQLFGKFPLETGSIAAGLQKPAGHAVLASCKSFSREEMNLLSHKVRRTFYDTPRSPAQQISGVKIPIPPTSQVEGRRGREEAKNPQNKNKKTQHPQAQQTPLP